MLIATLLGAVLYLFVIKPYQDKKNIEKRVKKLIEEGNKKSESSKDKQPQNLKDNISSDKPIEPFRREQTREELLKEKELLREKIRKESEWLKQKASKGNYTGATSNTNYLKTENKEQINKNSFDDKMMRAITMNISFRQKIEEEFEDAIKGTFERMGKKDPLTLGLSVQASIAYTSKYFKNIDFREMREITGMSKQETDAIIDEIVKKMLNKYLENY
jgi:hypothetical protein